MRHTLQQAIVDTKNVIVKVSNEIQHTQPYSKQWFLLQRQHADLFKRKDELQQELASLPRLVRL